MIAEVLIHHLDVVRFLCGPLRVVEATTRTTVADVARRDRRHDLPGDRAGRPVIVTGTMAAPGYPPATADRLEIIGSKASVVFERRSFELRLLDAHAAKPALRFNEAATRPASTAPFAHFVDCLETGAPVRDRPRRQPRNAAPGRGCLLGGRARIGRAPGPRRTSMDHRMASSHSLIGQIEGRAGYAGAAGRSRHHGSQYRADRRRLAARTASPGGRTSKATRRRRSRRMQIAAGAIGITCAKLGEAEVMAAAGHSRHPHRQPDRRRRSRSSRLVGCSITPIRSSRSTASRTRSSSTRPAGTPATRLRVVIEVNIGMNRAGRRTGRAGGRAAARSPAARPALRRRDGLGEPCHDASPTRPRRSARSGCRRRAHGERQAPDGAPATGRRRELRRHRDLSLLCASSPASPRCRSAAAIFSDMHYRNHYHVDFPPALTLLATVTSRPTPTRIVARRRQEGDERRRGDAGADRACQRCATLRLSAEHATIELEQSERGAARRRQDRVYRRLLRHHGPSARGDRRHAQWPRRGDLAGCRARKDQVAITSKRATTFSYWILATLQAIGSTASRGAWAALQYG